MNLHDALKKNKQTNNIKKSLIIGIIMIFLCVVSATFAYFSVMYDNTGIKNNNATGSAEEIAKPTLVTNIEELKINIDSKLMDQTKSGTTYYATPSGTPVTESSLGSGRYTLATANVLSGNVIYDCNYKYQITGTVSKAITDGSDEDVKITFINNSGQQVTYTLKQVLEGVEYTSKFTKLKVGEQQTIEVMAYVDNTSVPQDGLVGNTFTFKIEMTPGEEGFSCSESQQIAIANKGYYRIDSTADISSMDKVSDYYIKVSDDTPDVSDLMGAVLALKDSSESSASLPVSESSIGYQDNYITIIGDIPEQGNIEGVPWVVIVKNTPHNYEDTPYFELSQFNNAKPGIYMLYNPEYFNYISLLLPNAVLVGDYSISSETDITNMPKVPFPELPGAYLVKVSDVTPTINHIIGGTIYAESPTGETQTITIADSNVWGDDGLFIFGGLMVVVYTPFDYGDSRFSETGLYMLYAPDTFKYLSLTLSQ